MTWGSPGASCWALYGAREQQVSHQDRQPVCDVGLQHACPVLGAAGPNVGDSAWARFGGCPAGDDGWGRKPTGSPRQGQWVPRGLALAEVAAVWEDRTGGWGKPLSSGQLLTRLWPGTEPGVCPLCRGTEGNSSRRTWGWDGLSAQEALGMKSQRGREGDVP